MGTTTGPILLLEMETVGIMRIIITLETTTRTTTTAALVRGGALEQEGQGLHGGIQETTPHRIIAVIIQDLRALEPQLQGIQETIPHRIIAAVLRDGALELHLRGIQGIIPLHRITAAVLQDGEALEIRVQGLQVRGISNLNWNQKKFT